LEKIKFTYSLLPGKQLVHGIIFIANAYQYKLLTMAHSNIEPSRGSSYSTLILITIALLALLYFFAKGCTNHNSEAKTHNGASVSHN
jgi:hypothetical protein